MKMSIENKNLASAAEKNIWKKNCLIHGVGCDPRALFDIGEQIEVPWDKIRGVDQMGHIPNIQKGHSGIGHVHPDIGKIEPKNPVPGNLWLHSLSDAL